MPTSKEMSVRDALLHEEEVRTVRAQAHSMCKALDSLIGFAEPHFDPAACLHVRDAPGRVAATSFRLADTRRTLADRALASGHKRLPEQAIPTKPTLPRRPGSAMPDRRFVSSALRS
jgi:hypothetical protein